MLALSQKIQASNSWSEKVTLGIVFGFLWTLCQLLKLAGFTAKEAGRAFAAQPGNIKLSVISLGAFFLLLAAFYPDPTQIKGASLILAALLIIGVLAAKAKPGRNQRRRRNRNRNRNRRRRAH